MGSKGFCGFVPEEVTEQIVARIPCTKSLLRCTLVCKSWDSLIRSSRFIDNMHLYRPDSTKYLLCYTYSHRAGVVLCEYSLYSDREPSKNPVTLVFPLGLKYVTVRGCCNGVICYTTSGERQRDVYLWNPIARKLKILPKFRKFDEFFVETIGFWYDKEQSDYQVVKITCTCYRSVTSSVDVYSLRSNSWKTITDSCPGMISIIREHNLVYAKGTLHWLAQEGPAASWRFVSLDMNNAKFREALIISSGFEYVTLCLKQVDSKSFVIVKVHDESLELLYTDDSCRSLRKGYMVGYRNNGDPLLSLPAGDTVVSYDFSSRRLTDFVLYRKNIKFFSAYPFVETLVLLNDGDGQYYTKTNMRTGEAEDEDGHWA